MGYFKTALAQMKTNPSQYKHPIGPVGIETNRSAGFSSVAVHRPGQNTKVYNKGPSSSYRTTVHTGIGYNAASKMAYHNYGHTNSVVNTAVAHPVAAAGAVAGVAAAGYGAHKLYQHFQHRPVAPMHEKAASTFHATHAGLG